MTDDEIVHALAAALVGHPSWPEPKRINMFVLSFEDALQAVAQTFGSEAHVITLAFRSDVVASLQAVSGKNGFWAGDEEGVEMFVECETESEALGMFESAMGRPAIACVPVEVVVQELSRMDEAINGQDPHPLASQAFLAQLAADELAARG